jgi:hypothetical protein
MPVATMGIATKTMMGMVAMVAMSYPVKAGSK